MSRIVPAVLLCASVAGAGTTADVAQDRRSDDVTVLCSANDPEFLAHLVVYQLRTATEAANQHLYVRRLAPAPPLGDIREDTVFAGAATLLDSGLPPIAQAGNGPELGLDVNYGFEVVYTKEIDPEHWLVARWANYCVDLDPECWAYAALPGSDPAENRWRPFATSNRFQRARVSYYQTPGPRDTGLRIAWRDLEDPDLAAEHLIDDPNATRLGAWARIDGRDVFLVLYGPPDGDKQVALYDVDPPHARPPRQLVTNGPGSRDEAAVRRDPASGHYTLVAENVVGDTNVMEVYQRIGGVWTHRFDFDASMAGEEDPTLAWVQSPELFVYGNRLYLAFVTSDTGDFDSTTRGNIRITRIDADGPPTFFRLLSDATFPRKRTEPEIHFPANDSPVVYYTQRTEVAGEDGCNAGTNALRRARTRL